MSRKLCISIILSLCGLMQGCIPDKTKDQLQKWNLTLDHESKRPYGTYLAYRSLKMVFPLAVIESLPDHFRYTDMDDGMKYNQTGATLMILEGLDFYVSDEEWKELKKLAYGGNEVVILCSRLDDRIEKELGCLKKRRDEEAVLYKFLQTDDNKDILTISGEPNALFGYSGRSLKGYFSFSGSDSDAVQNDTDDELKLYSCDTLGRAAGQSDFIRYKIGKGHLFIHAAPLVLSNYFLLQDGNVRYLNALWQTMPGNISKIYWNSYVRRSPESSNFAVLWRFPQTTWALLVGMVALLVYVLFESKRKQRIIPVVPPLRNDSVSFVETVGRLYYNKGDHTNLAEKMVQQFLEWVRTHYFLNTNLLNEHFVTHLAAKSGQPEATVRGLLEMISEIRTGSIKPDDAYLYQLYGTIQQFYKNQAA